jgi:TolA-binding protein
MSSVRQKHLSEAPESLAELSHLGRAARLLEDAQLALSRVEQDADRRTRELRQRIRELEGNLSELEQLLLRTEQQASQLANLYVATYQLHASLDTGDVCSAIADIAVNLLGAERFTVWLRDEAGELRSGSHSYAGGDALVDACLTQASPQFGPVPGSEAVVALPFAKHGEVVGVLVIGAFFPHKPGLAAEDHELLDLMAAHAASALLAARAFHVSQRKLNAYQGLLGFLRGGGS